MSEYKIHLYTLKEEKLNTVSHAFAATLAFVGLVLMLIKVINSTPLMIFAMLLFSFATFAVYLFSAIYHGTKDLRLKVIWQKVDHSMVSVIIAGTAMPLLLIIASGTIASIMLALIIVVTIVNIILSIIDVHRFKRYSLGLYSSGILFIAIGLIFDTVISDKRFLAMMIASFAVIIIGGGCYIDKSRKYTHFAWHITDIICSILHFLAFYLFVI